MKKDSNRIVYGIKFSSLNGLSLVLSKIIRGLAIPKILSPVSYGLFSSINFFTRYLNLFDFGATAYFSKEVAKLDRGKKNSEFTSLVDQTFSVLVLGIFLSSVVLIGFAFKYDGENESFYKIAILLLIPIFGFTKVREFFMCFLYSTGQYRDNAVLAMASNYILMVLVTIGIYFHSAIGGVVAMLIGEMASFLLAISMVDLRPRVIFGRATLKRLKVYLDQNLLQVSETMATTADQALLLIIFGPVGFGVYVLGITFAWIFEALSEIFNTAFYPKMMMASKSSTDSAKVVLQKALFLYFSASLALIPGCIVGLTWLILVYFPKYQSGLDIFVLVLFFGVSRGAFSLLKKGYIAANKERLFIVNSIIVVSINCFLAVLASIFKLSLSETVYYLSIINLLSYLIFYLLLISKEHGFYFKNNILLLTSFALLFLTQLYWRDFVDGQNILIVFGMTAIGYALLLGFLFFFKGRLSSYIDTLRLDDYA